MKRNDTRYYSSRQEKKVAKSLGGRQTSNSGATKFDKGDVQMEDWLIECKTCTSPKSSMSIKKDWLDKNKEEAFAMQKSYNALAFDFGCGENYFIIDERTFKMMLDSLNNDD